MNSPKRKSPFTKCRFCGRNVRVRPAGGDWLNDIYPERHKNAQGENCEGRLHSLETHEITWPKPVR
jgi:hypothetical protein